jgi:hypothetical protein
MKKLLCIFISIILCFSFGMTAFAGEDDTAPSDNQSASQPRLMVESYTLSKPVLKPNESATLEIKLKNHSLKKNINNIAISLSDEANEISTIGVNSGYIDKIIPNSTYTYTATIRATKTASEGVHKLTVSLEYEDDDYTQYTSTSQISINVTKKKEAKKPTKKATTQNASRPQLIVTSYSLDGKYVSPSKSANLSVILKNESKDKSIKNLKLTISEEKNDIKFKRETFFVDEIKPKGTYTLNIELTAAKTAEIGEHKLVLASTYEDKYFTSFESSDNILINVKQKTALDYDGIILPKKLTQDDTATMEVNLMNTGKSAIRNAKISFDIDGLETGGVLFIGMIKAGESKTGSANFQVSSSKLGDVKGTATLSYEDDFGKSYSESISLSSTIIKKKAVKSESDMDKKKSKFSLWWLFLLIGLAIGGGVGAIIPISINQSKKRKEDDLRL